MQVVINEQTYEYTSDYSPGNHQKWKVKLKDAFCFEQVGPVRCFIKRFASQPAAWDLIVKIKGAPVTNIPKVYDAVSTTENNKPAWYLFTEYVPGKTLKEQILENDAFDAKKLLANITDALQFIHEHQFWFSDLNEENIYCSPGGDFYLIDVDSCWPQSARPTHDTNREGGMPGAAQEFANVALEFYREVQGITNFQYENIEGKNLNYLQLLALLAKLDYYTEHHKTNPGFKYTRKNFKGLHQHLLYKNEAYCLNVFSRAYHNSLLPGMVLQMGNFITGETAAPQVVNKTPVIDYFKSTSYSIYKGDSITLEWSVLNADSLQLNGDALYTVTNSLSKTVSPQSNQVYTLTARNSMGKEVSKTVQVSVLPVPMPQIQQFQSNTAKIKKGQPVVFSWTVTNANQLYFNGKELSPSITSQQLSPVKSATYTLLIKNNQGKTDSRQIKVAVQSSFSIGKLLGFGVVLLLVSLGIWQFSLYTNYKELISDANYKYDIKNYDEALTLYQQADAMAGKVWFGGNQDLNEKKNYCYLQKYLKDADNLVEGQTAAAISIDAAAFSSYFENLPSAKDYYLKAKQLLPDSLGYNDNSAAYITNMVNLCEKIQPAGSLFTDGDYLEARVALQTAKKFAKDITVSNTTLNMLERLEKRIPLPEDELTEIAMEPDKVENGQNGFTINVRVHARFLKSAPCQLAVLFYKENGEILPDRNGLNASKSGQVAAYRMFTPSTNDENSYFSVFMPINELDISYPGEYILKYKVGLLYEMPNAEKSIMLSGEWSMEQSIKYTKSSY